MDLNLTPDELRRLFDAVHERDMKRLRREHEELKASLKRAELNVWEPKTFTIHCPECGYPWANCKGHDQTGQGT